MQRFNVRKIISVILFGMIMFVIPVGLWAQNLEVHYINVQQGQSTLIIGPNGKVILYDGGYEFKGTNEVVPYLQSLGITTSQPLDYIIASHRDTDHFVGLTEVMNAGYDALHVYDNGSDKTNIYVEQFLTAAASTSSGGVTPIQLGQVIDLGNGAKATCVATNGYVIGSGLVPNGQANENDRATCLLIQYGNFDFLVTGDMGGGSDDTTCTGRSTSQVNIETPLIIAIMPGGVHPLLSTYGVEVAHIGHHGSESSGNADYMNALSPAVACVSVGDGQSADWFHPRKDVIENVFLAQTPCIYTPPALVLQTEEGNPTGEKTSFSGYCAGDIIITTDGASSYTVSATGAVSQGPDERTAAGLPRTFYFDETVAIDTAPALLNVHQENLGQASVDIKWSTNESATSRVKYGKVAGTYANEVNNSTLQMNHSFSLTGLTAGTTYYYIIESTDATSHTTTSMEYSFTTTGGQTGGTLVFSEVYYDTIGDDTKEEWIELYNGSNTVVDISGWTITDNNGTGATLTIPSGTSLRPGTFLTIAVNSGGFNALYGFDADIYGSVPALNNSGDALVLKDTLGNIIDAVAWEGGASAGVPEGWGSTTDPWAGIGKTIVRSDANIDTNTYADWTYAANNGNPQVQPTGTVVFSEIYYDTIGDDNIEEWIELYNNTKKTANIGGWTIIDSNGTGFTYTFPADVTIAPGTYFTVGRNSGGFTALYSFEADLYGNLPFLNNGGETLLLKDASGSVVDFVAWEGGAGGLPGDWGSTSNPWAKTGNTILRNDPTVDTDTYADWGFATNNGNPQVQTTVVVLPKIVFSEVYYDTIGDDTKEEWIEFYNNTTKKIDISGWTITDNNGTGATFTLPEGTYIVGGTYLTIAVNPVGFNALYSYDADVYGAIPPLNNSGDALILKDKNGNVIDNVAWEGGASSGIPTGWGSTSQPWAGTGNTIVRTDVTVDTHTYTDWGYATGNGNPQIQGTPGKVVFSEVYYDTIGDDAIEEWIEVYNNSSFAVNMSGWTITDNNGTGVTFTFPQGAIIQPATYFTVAVNVTGFRNIYGYTADIYGAVPPLNNSGDTLILKDHMGFVKDFVAWEGGASAGAPEGWGSTSNPWASTGNSIIRNNPTIDTDTYQDWGYATGNGYPQTQGDITPPVISGVQTGTIGIYDASVQWTTDEPADSFVQYGTVSGVYTGTLTDATLVTTHRFNLVNLAPATTYYYKVKSVDEAGNTSGSDEFSFTTEPEEPMASVITMDVFKHKNDVWSTATITVTSNGIPVEGAIVNVTWSDSFVATQELTTGVNGKVVFTSGTSHPNKWQFTITINSISKYGYFWDTANSQTIDMVNKHKHKDF